MLTKSGFLTYLDAPMHLWAQTHDQLEAQPRSVYDEFLSQQGQDIEALAKQYLEQVVIANRDDLRLDWQPTFTDGRFLIRADALICDESTGLYDLYEIKSATAVQKAHLYDLAFQILLLEKILPIRHVYLLHIDKTYQHGTHLDLEGFFTLEEVAEQVAERREEVAQLRQAAWEVTQMAAPKPEFACTKPRACPFPDLCHPDLPPNPIYNLPYLGRKAQSLREMGILAIEDVPRDFSLSPKQHLHLETVRSGQPHINLPAIRESLGTLRYPLYFLDYETFNPAVPLFRGYRPYEHIVFQYSLFVVEVPGADPLHFDALIADGSDPAQLIVDDLLDHIADVGSVVVWNKSFEAGRNQDLARHCPNHAEQLLDVNDRLYDLMLIFREGHYIHPSFQGSASLKAVLPVLCPELQYTDLSIQDGESAMLTWYQLHTDTIPPDKREVIISAMKDYCKMDTYGMVAIWDQLQKL